MADKPTDNRSGYFTQERITGDIDHYRAQRLAQSMLDAGLISTGEFDELSSINRETFSPLFAEIMPGTLDV